MHGSSSGADIAAGSRSGGPVTEIRLPDQRPPRIALATGDAAEEQRLRFVLALVRMRTGLLWCEIAPHEAAAGDVCVAYGAPPPVAEGVRTVVLGTGGAAALLREPRPALTLGADLPALAWAVGQPAPGSLMVGELHEAQPVLDLSVPWLDEIAERLARALVEAAPDDAVLHALPPLPGGAEWGIALSHDIDYLVTSWRYRATRAWYLRQSFARRAERPSARWMLRHYGAMVGAAREWRHRGAIAAERAAGVVSEWFVFARTDANRRGLQAQMYNPMYELQDGPTRALVADLAEGGHRIGLHASPQAGREPELLAGEKAALEALTGAPVAGVRHHLGSAEYPAIVGAWARAGFTYDSTCIINYGQAYRLGTCGAVPLSPPGGPELLEISPSWMDTAAFNWFALSPNRIGADLRALADRGRARGGLEGVVWHDIPMTHDHAEQRVYGDFLAYARENGALIAPPGRFAEHARGLLDSRLTEEPEGVRLQLAPGVEADGPRAFRSADPAR